MTNDIHLVAAPATEEGLQQALKPLQECLFKDFYSRHPV